MSIKLENVSYVYEKGTSTEYAALKNVDLEIEKGEFVAIIGHTGSGKSTLIQHFNGLEKCTEGTVYFDGKDISEKDFDLKQLRRRVGLVFQGLKKEECIKKAKAALELVGVSEELYEKSPFELSGGQKRRVAIAGVLAMEPDIIILDEPTAGLDPKGRDKILKCIKDLHDKKGIGVILVSHSMEDVANYAERIIVMNKGKVMYDDSPHKVFSHYKELEKMGLAAPQITYIMHILKEKGFNVDEDIINLEEAKESILKSIGR